MMVRFLAGPAILVILSLLLGSCKDMGESAPAPPLTTSVATFTLVPGRAAGTRMTGGAPPYVLVERGDANVVDVTLAGDSLKLRGLAAGSTRVTVGDQSSPRYTVSINITVITFGVDRNSFHLLTGDRDSATILGGVPPYAILAVGDTSRVAVDLAGSRVILRASQAGSTTIIVGDNSVPPMVDTITVSVTAAILFASQIQPIFTTNCVNAGCHPGGGAPFSLQDGSSYGRLVNVPASTGPCAGDMRVLPFSANGSALVKRIEGTCGNQMPLGGTPLAAGDIQLIRDWINQGARNN
jgi:hypothetical protein